MTAPGRADDRPEGLCRGTASSWRGSSGENAGQPEGRRRRGGRPVAELILGPMLRHVAETSATVWVETDQRCTVEILGRTTPTFCVAGHHFALVILEDLEPAACIEYDVRLDGEVRWPVPGGKLPASRIRTLGGGSSPRIVFGSCRTAAPHERAVGAGACPRLTWPRRRRVVRLRLGNGGPADRGVAGAGGVPR